MLLKRLLRATERLSAVGLLAAVLVSNTAEAQPFAYVTDSDPCFLSPFNRCVSVIDTATNSYKAPVFVNIGGTRAFTNGVAVTPDGTRVYVTATVILGAFAVGRAVLVIDTSTNMQTGTITISSGCTGRIAIAPDGRRAYVVGSGAVCVIDIDPIPSNALNYNREISASGIPITTPYQGDGIAITPNGMFAYLAPAVTLAPPDFVQVINIGSATPSVSSPISSASLPLGASFLGAIAITPDGRRAFVPVTNLPPPSPPPLIRVQNGFATIDTVSNSVSCPPVNFSNVFFRSPRPLSIATTPDGSRAYAVTVESIEMITIPNPPSGCSTTTPVAALNIPLGGTGGGGQIAIAPDGKHAYIAASQNHAVYVFDTDRGSPPGSNPNFNTLLSAMRVGETHGIAITPPCITVDLQIDNGQVPPTGQDSKHLQVAILSNLAFTAPTSVDTTKPLTFGLTGNEQSLIAGSCQAKDANKDGLPDLVCSFNNGIAGLQPGATAVLKGTTISGMCIQGELTIPPK